MRFDGRNLNFVFFDLSRLDLSSANAFLTDRSRRTGTEAIPSDSCCHWILAPMKGLDLLSAEGQGPEYLRSRLSGGDRLFCPNPTGFDWNALFPAEAEQEQKVLRTPAQEIFLFLESTSQTPGWIGDFIPGVFRASAGGLCIEEGDRMICLPWASKEKAPHRGVWWIVPGQALFTALPPGPWADLPSVLPRLWDHQPFQAKEAPRAPSPAGKRPAYAVGLLRRATSPSPLHQSVLFRSQDYPGLGTKEAVDFGEALGGIRKRSLVANMQGQTDLEEAGLQVRFQGGRLESIADSKTGIVLCGGTDSYLDWGGARHRFVVNSAFSFEGDYSWGLRQSLVLLHADLVEPGRAILDYFFVEESREFFVAVTVRWPRWRSPVTVNRWAVLEMNLFAAPTSAPLTTRVLWPDGRSRDQIHQGKSEGVLTGTDFVFAAGETALVLGFPQNQTPRPHFLPWHRVHRWSKSGLIVNPEGGQLPTPSEEFEGIEEHFTFYLNPAEGAKLPFSPTRKQAVELIPPYVVVSESTIPPSYP